MVIRRLPLSEIGIREYTRCGRLRRSPKRNRDTLALMRIVIYLFFLAALTGLAWQYPFLFELPLIAAIGGVYWVFFAKGEPPSET
jgi:hypothetical protein